MGSGFPAGCRVVPTGEPAQAAAFSAGGPSAAASRAVHTRHPDLVPLGWTDEGEGRLGALLEERGRRFTLVVGARGELLSRRESIDLGELPKELRIAAPVNPVLAAELVTVRPHGASHLVYRVRGPKGWVCVDRTGAPAVEFP